MIHESKSSTEAEAARWFYVCGFMKAEIDNDPTIPARIAWEAAMKSAERTFPNPSPPLTSSERNSLKWLERSLE